ncbi:MAG: PorP/SprF family type IX secretion system membrane protein [Bacteroidales bacterium]|nr:PorP/SprF family type IX secretion system membrane protein [Bacteroidales bacterium]
MRHDINIKNTPSRTPITAVLLAIMVLASNVAMAQIEGQYTQFMFNRLTYNPAYAGSSGAINVFGFYRNQWMGLQLDAAVSGEESGSTPTEYMAAIDLPVSWLHGGIGVLLAGEEIGYRKNNLINLDYAFRIVWGPGTLAAAIEADLLSATFDKSLLHGYDDYTGDPSNPVSAAGDPLLNGDKTSASLFDLATGLYYQVPGLFYAGFSVKNLLASHSEDLAYKNARNFYFMGGYDYTFPYNPAIKIKPSALVKTSDFAAWQADVACLVDYRNLFWAGASYRVTDAVALLVGANVEVPEVGQFQVGAAYDLVTSRLGTYKPGRSFGSIELYLKFSFKVIVPKKPPSSYGNTRYLR